MGKMAELHKLSSVSVNEKGSICILFHDQYGAPEDITLNLEDCKELSIRLDDMLTWTNDGPTLGAMQMTVKTTKATPKTLQLIVEEIKGSGARILDVTPSKFRMNKTTLSVTEWIVISQ